MNNRFALAMFGLPLFVGACHGSRQDQKNQDDFRVPFLPRYEARASHLQPLPQDASRDAMRENPFLDPQTNPLSTFAIDVDTASYSLVRQHLNMGVWPDPEMVRAEELINYFPYDYEGPDDERPFAVHSEVAAPFWQTGHRLVKVTLKGREVVSEDRPAANLVFLIDVSGSMEAPDKLPLLKRALTLLVGQLKQNDHVAIVVYAGDSGVVLPPTPGNEKEVILAAIEGLTANGSTNGQAGLQKAYDLAREHFQGDSENRVILCTDGDFNVGLTNGEALVELITAKARDGIFLTALGFGMNSNDNTLETLADKGNGVYGYIDGMKEARKIFQRELTGSLVTIAKDVKVQVAFEREVVSGYRLIGYENRLLSDQDFKDDSKDGGEIGAGHTVTALYEVKLKPDLTPTIDEPLNLLTVRVRYQAPTGEDVHEFSVPVVDKGMSSEEGSDDFRFVSSVAGFAMLLNNSQYSGETSWEQVRQVAEGSLGPDLDGYRQEFLDLVEKARVLAGSL